MSDKDDEKLRGEWNIGKRDEKEWVTGKIANVMKKWGVTQKLLNKHVKKTSLSYNNTIYLNYIIFHAIQLFF